MSDIHDLDFERLWVGLNKMDRRVMQALCGPSPGLSLLSSPTSTVYSTVNRLMKKGYVIKDRSYEIEDPFFKRWIVKNRL